MTEWANPGDSDETGDAAIERWLRDEVVPVAKAMQADPSRAIPLGVVFDGLRALHAKRLGRTPPSNGSA